MFTSCSLSGTLLRKSRASLLGMLWGLKSLRVNLLTPQPRMRNRNGTVYSKMHDAINKIMAK
jgi:hypothetical protein